MTYLTIVVQCIFSTNITNNCFYFKMSWSLSHPRGFRTLTLSSETSAGVAVWNAEERKMWPDGDIVGYGLALTLILGVMKTQWQSQPAFRAFAKNKVLTHLKGGFPPGRMEKWNYPCLLNLPLNFTQIITYDPMDPEANCFFLCLPLPQSPVCLVCSDRKKLFHQLC